MRLPSRFFAAPGLVLASLFFWSCLAVAGDWPAWRHDAGRSGATDEQLSAELHLQWSRQLPHLKAAWPEDVRLQFDANYEPVVVGKLMIVASSRNDSVTAYDTATGERRWRFFADAPVRFAPVASGGSVYFGADDGCLYRLDAVNGTLINQWNATPSDRTALGNERLISVWPVRGGPVIVGDSLHFTVGVWPFEGTYLTSLKLEEGAELAPLTPLDNSTPQGYLASNGVRLVIPGGRANALCRDLTSGKRVSLNYTSKGLTDSHVIAHQDWMFHGGKVVDLDTGRSFGFDAIRPLVSDGKIYFSANGKAHAYDLKNVQVVDKVDRKGNPIKVSVPTSLWAFSEQPVTALHLKTAGRLYGHHGNTVFAIDLPQTPEEKAGVSFSTQIEGTCSSMLAADGKLFVVTKEGRIDCFGPNQIEPKKHTENTGQVVLIKSGWAEKAGAILKQTKVKGGYCLALGIGTGGLIEELIGQSDLTIIVIDPDAAKVDQFRRSQDAKGFYGTRVVAIQGSLDELRLPPYLANLLVSEDTEAAKLGGDNLQQAFRTLRPYGGVACFEMPEGQHVAFAEAAATSNLPNAVVGRSAQLTTITREGALPGAANWTHEYGDAANTLMSQDRLVKAPLGVLWFGGPASDGELFYNRHFWGPSAAIIDGRMFIQGPDKMTAVDVYTGRILWKISLKEQEEIRAGRRGWNFETVLAGFHFAASPDALYLVDGRTIIRIDPETGEQLSRFVNPDKDVEWGRPLVHDDLLIVSVFHDTEKFGRLPTELVALDKETGERRWTKEAGLSFPVFALGGDKLFCFDGAIEDFYDIRKRRGAVPGADDAKFLRAIDLKTGKDLWKEPTDIVATWLSYSGEQDVMVVSNREKVAAFRGKTGESLWRKYSEGMGFKGHPENYWDKVILWKDRILDQRGPGQAYDLESGDTIMRKHPVTGEAAPWSFTKSGHHCNYAIANEHLMTFRAADAGFCDLESGGTGRFTGFRSGCRNSLIPANGLLNAPNFSHGCKCSYSLFTSLALMHVPETDMWTYSAHKAGDGPVQHLGINFGARGDRTAENGTLWMDHPSVGGASPSVPIDLVTDDPQWFHLPSTQVTGDGLNWVAASGVSGVESIKIPVLVGKNSEIPENRAFTVRLSFIEPDAVEPGQRIFGVSIQGKRVLQDFEVMKEAGDTRRILVKEFRGVMADRDLTITFTPKTGQALICGVEVVAESN